VLLLEVLRLLSLEVGLAVLVGEVRAGRVIVDDFRHVRRLDRIYG
jgi:hypothetical protein